MSQEERDPNAPKPNGNTPDIAAEIREMGQQVEAMFRAAIESERTKQLQRDLTGGVREISTQLQEALKSLQTNPRVQQAEERGRQVFSQAQQSQFAQDVQEAMATGITQINQQLRKVVERLEHERTATGGSTPTQHVPVETENSPTTPPSTPTTGDTTKLD